MIEVIKLEQSEKYLNGLSEKEAEIRLKKYGLNEIQEKEEPFIKKENLDVFMKSIEDILEEIFDEKVSFMQIRR